MTDVVISINAPRDLAEKLRIVVLKTLDGEYTVIAEGEGYRENFISGKHVYLFFITEPMK